MKSINQEELKRLFSYEPTTGIFTQITKVQGSKHVGESVGWKSDRGYLYVKIKGRTVSLHRLAFLYMEGYFPENDVDHINRIRTDNRWCNLREVSKSCNKKNTGLRNDNKSGVSGVYSYKVSKGLKYRSEITTENKTICLPCRNTFKEAVQDRWEAEKKYNYPNCQTDSSSYKWLIENGGIQEDSSVSEV